MGGYQTHILYNHYKLDDLSLVGLIVMILVTSFGLVSGFFFHLASSISKRKVVLVLVMLGYYVSLSMGFIGEVFIFI
jgi:hypothetical protein